MVAHMGQMAGWADINKGCHEGAHIVAHAPNPIPPFGRGACQNDHIAALKVRHRSQKWGKSTVVTRVRTCDLAKGMAKPDHRIRGKSRCQHGF